MHLKEGAIAHNLCKHSYVGSFSNDYSVVSGNELDQQSMWHSTGCGDAMLSNRLSWFYDMKGPSFSIDTACSSSMVALHYACRDLQDGTTTMVGLALFVLSSRHHLRRTWPGPVK